MLKKTLVALVLALTFGAAVESAQAFPLPTYVTYQPFAVTISVTNPYGVPVACYGTIQGLRNDGFTQFANIQIGPILYGMTGYGYAYTSAPYFFVNAFGAADCGFLY